MSLLAEKSPAQTLLTWLSQSDELSAPVDAMIGFGHFDRRIPALCGELFKEGRAHHIVFTGGIGAGTGTIGMPEADFFRAELQRQFPTIGNEHVFVENRSTNTAENIRFTEQQLARDSRQVFFGQAIRSAILVVHPLRLRRVRQTWLKLLPNVRVTAIAPRTTLANEQELYARENLSLEQQLVGEIDRLIAYPKYDWIEPLPIPYEILFAREEIK